MTERRVLSRLPADIQQARDAQRQVELEREERVKRLRSIFDGAIRYWPMLDQHQEWTDEQCIAFAREWHAKALEQWRANPAAWNHGIPYGRNDVSKAGFSLEDLASGRTLLASLEPPAPSDADGR